MITQRVRPMRKAAASELAGFKDRLITHYRQQSADRVLSPNATRSHVSEIRRVMRLLADIVGITRLADLDDEAVRQFEAGLEKAMPRASERARLRQVCMLRAYCKLGVRWNLLASMPQFPLTRDPRSFPVDHTRRRRLSPDDVRALLTYLRSKADTWVGKRLQALVITMLFTGLYLSEALSLQLADVDLAAGIIRIRRRQRWKRSLRPATVQLFNECKEVLSSWLPQTGCEWVFPGIRRNNSWYITSSGSNEHCAVSHLKQAGRAIGVPDITYESVRRYFDDNAEHRLFELEAAAGEPELEPAIKLGGRGDCVLVLGRPLGPIGGVAYEAIESLLSAGPAGLSKSQMDNRCEFSSWRQALTDLRKTDRLWAAAIIMAGRAHGRYKINWI